MIVGMVAIMIVLVLIVAGLAAFRPGALSGKPDTTDKPLNLSRLSPAERIAKYQELIEEETTNSLLSDFHVPDGYKSEISIIPGLTFGFCYPALRNFRRLPQQIQYGVAMDLLSVERVGFARNLAVVISDISEFKGAPHELYEQSLQEILQLDLSTKSC